MFERGINLLCIRDAGLVGCDLGIEGGRERLEGI
jgi:hypothetical protein